MKIAHTKEGTLEEAQLVSKHNQNVAILAKDFCRIALLKQVCFLAGIFHDAGKYKKAFQEYIIKSTLHPGSVSSGEVVHSTGGAFLFGRIMDEMKRNATSKNEPKYMELLKELVCHAILSHHGVYDCVTKEGETIYNQRINKETETDEITQSFTADNDMNEITRIIRIALKDLKELIVRITTFAKSGHSLEYGNSKFYIGYCERMILSCLIHADRTDTMCYMQGLKIPSLIQDESQAILWEQLNFNYNCYMSKVLNDTLLNQCRADISNQCFRAASYEKMMFHLVVPTSGGKTLSSLRYALEHARRYKMKHIFYIAPYNSILEQNASVIRDAAGEEDAVLEHHSNIISDDEEYHNLTNTWDSPIVVTTAVQLLNTLFSSKSSSIRRFQALAESIIIMDEVQSIPIRCIKLFNMAMNFFNQFAGTTVILCSATMPLFDHLDQNRLLTPVNMVTLKSEYQNIFFRTSIIDDTMRVAGGMDYHQTNDYLIQKSIEAKNMLVIVNTKQAAKELYERVKEYYDSAGKENATIIYHLSTNMCAAHRKNVLVQIREDLRQKKKVICITTALIEAGVDISFHYVIRSLSGLDSIIQAAGRCNRSNEFDAYGKGKVYIIQIKEEKISSLVDIVHGQEATQTVLHNFRVNPERFGKRLDSSEAIELYYQIYFMRRVEEMEYNCTSPNTTLVKMLSENQTLTELMDESLRKHTLLKQAFRTAGDMFEVIMEDGKIDVIVEYDERSKKLIDEINNREYCNPQYRGIDYKEVKKLIQQLQPYTVGISEVLRQKLGSAIDCNKELGIQILKKEFYDSNIGVSEIPGQMDSLMW